MKQQHLEVNELINWVSNTETVYATKNSNDKHVRLCVTHSGGYKIYEGRELTWQGMQPYQAVEKFNSI